MKYYCSVAESKVLIPRLRRFPPESRFAMKYYYSQLTATFVRLSGNDFVPQENVSDYRYDMALRSQLLRVMTFKSNNFRN